MRFILSNTEKINSRELLLQAKKAGLLDSNVTINGIEFLQEVESIYQSIETQQAIVGGILFDW